jgi:integrase
MPRATVTASPDEPKRGQQNKRSRVRNGLVKRGNTWSYVIRVTDPETGVSRPKWVGGEYIDRNSITVAEYLNDWIDSHAMEIKPRTLADYRGCIRLYVSPRIGNMRLQAIRPSTITKLYHDLLTKGGNDGGPLAVSTVVHTHAIMRKAFGDAVTVDELLPSNPVERAKRPRAVNTAPGTVWTPAQLATFLAAARQHRLFAFYHVAAYTGARRGELLNLRWPDIDFDGLKITISGSTGIINGARVNGTTKSGRSRVVTIDDDTASVLREHRKAQAADQLLAGEAWKGNDKNHVFTTGWGEQIYPDTVGWLMTKVIRSYNAPADGPRPTQALPHARVHDLRHIHATTLLLNGVPVHVVAARLGHADPAITLRVYAHIIRTAETAAAEIFARVMTEAA